MRCPKCDYERQASDTAPEWQCPSCKVAYAKVAPSVTQRQATPRADLAAASRTKAQIQDQESDERLSLAARGQKAVIYSILLNFILTAAERSHALPNWVVYVLFVLIGIYSMSGMLKICSGIQATQNKKIVFMTLVYFPLVNLIVFVFLSRRATRLLRDAGWEVGLFGART
jgi:hypothetical protein